MNKIDIKALEIETLIRSHIKEKDYENIELVGVFFHELMIYSTNYYIIKNSKEEYNQDIKFPFLNSEYIENTPSLEFNSKSNLNKKVYRILEFAQKFIPLKKTIYIASSNSTDIKKFILRNVFRYRFKQMDTKLNLSHWNKHIDKMKDLLFNISNLIDIDNTKKDNFIKNFINYINSYKTDKEISLPENDCLLIDSNMNIENRIGSIAFLQNKARVISLGHGEHSIQVFDEPMVNYAELSYITDYITYGQNCIKLNSSFYKTPHIYYRSSDLIQKYFNTSKISFKKLEKKLKILYVPTSFTGNLRYGPYRDMEDKEYARWQKELLNSKYNITYKQHVNVNYEVDFEIVNLEKRNLKEVMHEYDSYILDYISTASALLFATNKPIIFFDLGLRKLQDKAKKDFDDRVFRYSIDFEDSIDIQLEKAFLEYNSSDKKYINTYTNKYSINQNNNINIIDEVIEGGN